MSLGGWRSRDREHLLSIDSPTTRLERERVAPVYKADVAVVPKCLDSAERICNSLRRCDADENRIGSGWAVSKGTPGATPLALTLGPCRNTQCLKPSKEVGAWVHSATGQALDLSPCPHLDANHELRMSTGTVGVGQDSLEGSCAYAV